MLAHRIACGEYVKGELLPSINTLSAEHEVSRDTVFKAFLDLKERGFIGAAHGKGYYVMDKITNVLLLLDEYSPFKDTLYNSFVERLPGNYRVDLLFHQYNEKMFSNILRESLGRYAKYVVMNFHNEIFSDLLHQVDPGRLLLLDFGKFEKEDIPYVCQNFDENFKAALQEALSQFRKYRKLYLVFPKRSKHPLTSQRFFAEFCEENHFRYEIIESTFNRPLEKAEAYIVINLPDLVDLVKRSRCSNLTIGTVLGFLAYNDIASYEVIDKGITSISVDFGKMGELAADFVLEDRHIQTFLPTHLNLRGSL